jgi:hypothetical protein
MDGGKDLADRLYRFTKGSYAGFANRPTNIDTKNDVVVFSIRDLEEELRPIAMYIVLNYVWNVVRSELKRRSGGGTKHAHDEIPIPPHYSLTRPSARKYYLGSRPHPGMWKDFLSSLLQAGYH